MGLNNMKVSSRLAFAFGLILVMMLITAGFTLSKLAAIQSNLEDVVLDNNVKIKHNNDMSDAVGVVSRVMRSVLLLSDEAAKQGEVAKIKKARETYDKAWEALNKMPADAAGQAARAKIQAARNAARPLNDKVIEMGMDDNFTGAVTLLFKEANPATLKWQEAIDENIDKQEEHNKKQYEEAVTDYKQARAFLIGANVVAAALAVFLGWLVSRSITGQLGGEPAQATQLAQSVAQGDLSTVIPLQAGDTSSMMAQLAAMQESLSKVVMTVRQSAEGVATASAEIAQGTGDLSSRTEQQASSLEETAASMEQMGSTVKQTADSAKQANQLARGASDVAVRGGEVVGEVVETMKGINESSRKIADIISVIDGIAFQTNILALNAAVEAARAGEQGRGFAVVASEVRSLAGRSAEAAKEIKSLISASVERVEQGSVLVDRAGTTMAEIVEAIKRATDIMGEISAASAEESTGVAQVVDAVGQMDQVTQQNAALVEQSAAAADSLRQQAQHLVETVAIFKLAGGSNYDTVRRINNPPAAAPRPAPKSLPARPQPKALPKNTPPKLTNKVGGPASSAPVTAKASGASDDWESF